jgi:hypothetical protein
MADAEAPESLEPPFPDAPFPGPPATPWVELAHLPGGPRFINLTVRVDTICLMYARLRAMREGTSLNAMLAEWVAAYSGKPYDPPPSRQPRMPRPRDVFDEAYRLRKRYNVRLPPNRL